MDIVSFLKELVKKVLEAEEKFYQDPKNFYDYESAVKNAAETFSAEVISNSLTELNKMIANSDKIKDLYTIQRTDKRTIISSVGDITFENTYYKSIKGNRYIYLLEALMEINKNERFTEKAEEVLLIEALKTSYNEATKVLPSKQKITKTTVMNKVHQIEKEMPYQELEKHREVDYLYIESDEDHISEQHGDATKAEENKSFISKLIYVYEGKKEKTGEKKRKELINTFYFSGLYSGTKENAKLWGKVQDYINKTYNTDKLKKIFIIGDGENWIKSGTEYIDNSIFCDDKFHLMKYINIASGQMLDEKESVKSELWHILYSTKGKPKQRFDEYTKLMMKSAKRPERIEMLRTFVLGNWAPIRRTLKNKLVCGCSAEGHVSHILSSRLSTKPMGWSQTGADRMSKLSCYEKNYGREKIIDLVKYSRQQRHLKATGTDDAIVKDVTMRDVISEHYNQANSYIDRIQAHIPGRTVNKTIAIRNQISLI